MKQKSLVYFGLLVVVAWFTSQACFPIIYPQTPDPCASTSPAPTGNAASAVPQSPCPTPTPNI